MSGTLVREAESGKLIRCDLEGGGEVEYSLDLDVKSVQRLRNLNLQVLERFSSEYLHVAHAVNLEVNTEGEVGGRDLLSLEQP